MSNNRRLPGLTALPNLIASKRRRGEHQKRANQNCQSWKQVHGLVFLMRLSHYFTITNSQTSLIGKSVIALPAKYSAIQHCQIGSHDKIDFRGIFLPISRHVSPCWNVFCPGGGRRPWLNPCHVFNLLKCGHSRLLWFSIIEHTKHHQRRSALCSKQSSDAFSGFIGPEP